MVEVSKKVGIQGGPGSFNEQAAITHLGRVGIPSYELSYLHTTENVFKSLENKEIDLGQFAIRNSLGGEVEESLKAMNSRDFVIVATYEIKISHTLMIHKNAKISDIETIITHPQVLRQCKQNLERDYSNLKLKVCDGELIDPAKVAELLGQGKISKTIATISNKALSQMHGLTVVADNLQDADANYTTFLLVKFCEN